jgi:hypothetical protein
VLLENASRVVVEHPENIAFDSVDHGRERLFVLGEKMGNRTTLSAMTSLAQ